MKAFCSIRKQECERVKKKLNTALVSRECARKKIADQESTSAATNSTYGTRNIKFNIRISQRKRSFFKKKMTEFGL